MEPVYTVKSLELFGLCFHGFVRYPLPTNLHPKTVYFFFSLPMIPIHHMQAHALTARLLEQ